MADIISILNNKGGVGKTTSTVHLAHALTKKGKKVLCVDVDDQANLLMHIFSDNEVYALEERQNGTSLPIMKHSSGVDVLPLSYWKNTKHFADTIRTHAKDYDYTLLDCPPSLESRTLAALDASTAVLIPTEPERLSYKGLIKLINLCEERRLPVLGIFVTRYDKKKAAHNFYLPEIARQFAGHYVGAIVPSSAIFSSASAMIKMGHEWTGKKANPALDAYDEVAEYILKHSKEQSSKKATV